MKKLLFVFPIFTFLIFNGCKKNTSDIQLSPDHKSTDVNVVAAKNWYNGIFKKSAEWAGYSAKNRTSGETKSQKEPDWKNGTYNKLGNLEITEFPLFRSSTSFSLPAVSLTDEEKIKIAKASLSRIAFIKNEKNEIMVREIDYIPEWQYLQKKNFDISKVMYGKPGDDFTGSIFIKNWSGDILGLYLLENGKVTKRGRLNKSISNSNPSYRMAEECRATQYCVWRQDCVEWYSGEDFLYEDCGNWYNTGNCWVVDYCSDGGGGGGTPGENCNTTTASTARAAGSSSEPTTSTVSAGSCPCEFYGTCPRDCADVSNGTAINTDECGCIGGTTGITSCTEFYDPEADDWEDHIEESDLALNPCANNTYKKLKKTNAMYNALKGFMGSTPVVHLDWDITSSLGANGQTTYTHGNFYVNIALDKDYLNQASNIAVARTMLHEAIHAEMMRKMISVGWAPTSKDFPGLLDYYTRYKYGTEGTPQHNMMSSHYRGQIISGLKEFDRLNGITNRASSFYEALSWGGFHGTRAWNELSETTRKQYLDIIQQQHTAGGCK